MKNPSGGSPAAALAPGPLDDAPFQFLPSRLRAYLHVAPGVLRDPPRYLLEAARRYGGIVTLSTRRVHLVSRPDYVKQVLQDNHLNYVKGLHYEVVKPVLGEGLLASDGELWRRQRRLIQPAFSHLHHAAMTAVIVQSTQEMLERWRRWEKSGQPVDARGELILLTLDILLRSMFGADVKGHEEELREAILEVERHKDLLRAFNPLKPPQWVPTPANLRLKKAIGTLDRFIYRMVDERRKRGQTGGDLASSLLFARDEESGQGMSDQQLRDELMTMIQAGHDTVSDAVNWTWYLLGKHPEIRQRLEREVDSSLEHRVPGMDDLSRLGYVTKVVHESMRLYPPGWAFARTPIQDDNIGGYHIPANSLVVLSPYVTQRLAECWEDPETFDPERFSEERSQGRPRFAYFPFGGGPRQCIGLSMGTLEALFIVTMVAQRYRLELEPEYIAALKPGFSLKPARTIFVTLRPR